MNVRYDIKCKVCNYVFITKVQLGYVEKANIRLGCPKCKSLIKGTIYQNAPDYSVSFENAEYGHVSAEANAEIFSLSTELPILKQTANAKNNFGFSLSPFIALTGIIPLNIFRDRYLEFRNYREKYLMSLETLIELTHNKKWDYVFSEAKNNFFPELSNNLIKNKELSFHLVSQIIRGFINKAIPTNYEHSYTIRFLYKATLTNIQKDKVVLDRLDTELNTYINVDREFVIALKICLNFIINLESYLPVIGLSYGKGFDAVFNDEFLITTFSFEELRDIYKDSFELLARASIVYIGFSNYLRNNDPNNFSDISSLSNLTEFYNMNNGNKKDIISKVPLLQKYFRSLLDSQIRNSIGHNKTEYYIVEQLIKYYPYTDLKKKDIFKEKSLVDFAYLTYLMNLCVTDLVSFIGKWNYRMGVN